MSEHLNIVYQQFIAMYHSGCQICCNWSTLQPDFMFASKPKYHAADKCDNQPSHLRPKKFNVVFPLSLLKKIGSVGRNFFYFIRFFISIM